MKIAEHAIDAWISSEDLPDPHKRVAAMAPDQIQPHCTFLVERLRG
ncbi:MAG: hypothetical protein ACK6AD_06205 [Cyanobacteriota bacterium]|jgi:hypothetical protein